jgi:nitroreductase
MRNPSPKGPVVDVALAVASKRDHRSFADTPIPDQVLTQILDAGRLAGSARNRQPWHFVVARTPDARARLAAVVYVGQMVRSAPTVVAITVDESGSRMAGFDAGRAAQNMMLAAWELGVASCPNGIADPEAATRALGLGADQTPVTILAFGYPSTTRDPTRRSAAQWSGRAHRNSLEHIVREF